MQFLPQLVGNQFRPAEGKAAFRELAEGDVVTLERDYENEYDANAIKVLNADGVWLGFIDRGNAADMARILDKLPSAIADGHEPEVTATVYELAAKPTLLVEITTGYEVPTEVRKPE